MRSLVIAVIVACAFAAPARAQVFDDVPNAIGVYVTPDIGLETLGQDMHYTLEPGIVPAYVVLTNPINFFPGGEPGQAPITHVGGFEFRLEFPDHMLLLSVVYPAGSNAVNQLTPPDFQVDGNFAVTGWATTLVELLFLWVTSCDAVFLAPVLPPDAQSIPGSPAITDADDGYRLNAASTPSGMLEFPVFLLGCIGDDTVDETWGSVKSLYR